MRRTWRLLSLLSILTLVSLVGPFVTPATPAAAYPVQGSYKGEPIENCADPAITNVTGSDKIVHWYMYCTADPLNDADRTRSGGYNFHLMAILHSTDLITWNYVGDVFSKRPRWVAPNAGLWAPDIQFFNGKWYLYYSAAGTIGGGRYGDGSAIGVATSTSPTGPWTDSGGPVVEKQAGRWVIDPFVITETRADGSFQRYIFYGSFAGGVSARTLSADGLKSDATSERPITVADRYEGTFIRKYAGYYYLFASSTDCCNEGLTGYSVFVGRSQSLLGPYVDREGVSMLDSRTGGTPVLSMNGNTWIGVGHNSVFTDFAGQDWFVYHGVNRYDPHFAGRPDYTKRAPLLDPLDWIDGWPTVRGGLWASESHQDGNGQTILKPAAQPGESTTYTFQAAAVDLPDSLIAELSDEFNAGTLSGQWSWVRPPAAGTFGLTEATFRFDTQAADLWKDRNDASVLVEPAPQGNYVVETKVNLNVPAQGSGYNYVQAGLVIYGDDNNYLKLVHVAINGTRQTEFAKEIPAEPRYGSTVVGPPADWTWLRIVKRTNPNTGEELYSAYSSRDGTIWVRGGTWTHNLGSSARIGLVAMSGSGFAAQFDYLRVSTVKTQP